MHLIYPGIIFTLLGVIFVDSTKKIKFLIHSDEQAKQSLEGNGYQVNPKSEVVNPNGFKGETTKEVMNSGTERDTKTPGDNHRETNSVEGGIDSTRRIPRMEDTDPQINSSEKRECTRQENCRKGSTPVKKLVQPMYYLAKVKEAMANIMETIGLYFVDIDPGVKIHHHEETFTDKVDCLRRIACNAGKAFSNVGEKELFLALLDKYAPEIWTDPIARRQAERDFHCEKD